MEEIVVKPQAWGLPEVPHFDQTGEAVYALMVTGKDQSRARLATRAIVCFLEQDYGNRYLVIVNHGDYRFQVDSVPQERIIQVALDHRPSLGQMRNLTLDQVPPLAICLQWDDDDWRHPQLMRLQVEAMLISGAEAAFPGFQIKYAFDSDSGWVDYHPGGFAGGIMFRKKPGMDYRHVDRHEDSFFCLGVKTMSKWITWENEPHHLLRFIHATNTSGEEHFSLQNHAPGERDMPERCRAYLEQVLFHYR